MSLPNRFNRERYCHVVTSYLVIEDQIRCQFEGRDSNLGAEGLDVPGHLEQKMPISASKFFCTLQNRPVNVETCREKVPEVPKPVTLYCRCQSEAFCNKLENCPVRKIAEKICS